MERDPTQRFSDRVQLYIKYRPSYPPEIMTFLEKGLGFDRDKTAADVGSGSGILTSLLLEKGKIIFAVEPNEPMRQAAELTLGNHPHFKSIAGRAEATTLPDTCVDFIFAAQAFHWFDPKKTKDEFIRILKKPGTVAVIWNERNVESSPFARGYEDLLLRYATDYLQVRVQNLHDRGVLDIFFEPAEVKKKSFANAQKFDLPSLQGRLLSSSYCPKAGENGHDQIMSKLKELFENQQKDNHVTLEYDTNIFYGNLK